MIADNYAPHKHSKVQRRFQRHPRFHMHFTPTSASWLNMVERFFRDLTQNRLRRGVFHDLEELIMAIGEYMVWVPEILARFFRKFWHDLPPQAIPRPT